MANHKIAKYLEALESLKLTEHEGGDGAKNANVTSDEKRLAQNNIVLRKFMPRNVKFIIDKVLELLDVSPLKEELHIHLVTVTDQDEEFNYVLHMQYMFLKILDNVNFNSEAKENLISNRHINLCIKAIQDLATYALRKQLHTTFYELSVFANGCRIQNEYLNYGLLILSVEVFARILKINQFHIANAMELVIRDYMAAIFSLLLANSTKEFPLQEQILKNMKEKLNYIWLHITKVEYFRNIMLLKSMPGAHFQLQRQLHQELLQKLLSKDGFTTLVATLHIAQSTPSTFSGSHRAPLSDKHIFEIIAKIVAFRGHTQCAQNILMRQILKFLDTCLINEKSMIDCMGAGLLSLRRLYDLSESNRQYISEIIKRSMLKFSKPADVLSGLIMMEHQQLSLLLTLLYQLFCSSTVECLPSELLISYLPLLLHMYHQIPEGYVQKKHLASLITQCLHNRTADTLREIISKLYNQELNADWHQLHQRIIIYPNIEQTQLTAKIGSLETQNEFSPSLAVTELLMNSDHHILTYRVFTILLQQMHRILDDDSLVRDEDQFGLLHTEAELIALLNSKYPVKVEILLSLNTLISHQPLKAQISENSVDFLRSLRALLEQRLSARANANKASQQTEAMDQTLLILLTLTQELLEQAQIPEAFRDFMPALRQLQTQSTNMLVQERIKCLLTLLSGEFKANAAQQSTEFNAARALVESKESHLRVYGIQMLRDLLRNRDSVALANTHILLALALSALKDQQSYTFLNCVHLFTSLVYVLEGEVLDTLVDEYLNERANMDYRLVVGEAILKVGRELGALCYKYKDILLNSFMHGARSPLNEFRMSSFSNLAQMIRTLCYQVHTFFQELLQLIDCELSTGTYLPAKRAATLVLSELLEGMPSLLDFEDVLLPIYRMLKLIESDERADEKMRQHAANGLQALAEKCRKSFLPEIQLQKEIRIRGINEPSPKEGSAPVHILKLN